MISPLVALAAFFEAQGKITGLVKATSVSASRDAQLSVGNALNDREEAVLQAPGIMTRGEDNLIQLNASDLRKLVARLLDQPMEQFGHVQLIAQILSRLHLPDNSHCNARWMASHMRLDEAPVFLQSYQPPS